MLASNTNGVFLVLFLNTGFLLTIANANLTEHPPHFITKHFVGPYYDYEPEWYAAVGFLILKTMIINAFLPFSGLAMGYFIPLLKRKMDMKFGKNRYVTKKTSMIAYKKLWSGGEYIMHVKDSGILLIVFVTSMYGVGMPLLFPVAALTLLINFSVRESWLATKSSSHQHWMIDWQTTCCPWLNGLLLSCSSMDIGCSVTNKFSATNGHTFQTHYLRLAWNLNISLL